MSVREAIYQDIRAIVPFDATEEDHRADALAWMESGVEVFRLAKPATPPKHLVSFFVMVDGDHVLLVDHKKALQWLPSGGHVEVGEHPKTTVEREITEELGVEADFVWDKPLMVTVRETIGTTAGHWDVSVWYVVKGDRTKPVVYDETEFNGVGWFPLEGIPENCDPNLPRFVAKLIKELA